VANDYLGHRGSGRIRGCFVDIDSCGGQIRVTVYCQEVADAPGGIIHEAPRRRRAPPKFVRTPVSSKLLTIAIPTYNRAEFLELCLRELAKQFPAHRDDVEILVSDNHSIDTTPLVIERYQSSGTVITYIRNNKNIGADPNIAQCFNRASGKYVLILGDDDLLLPGTLDTLISRIKGDEYGVIFMQPYGYKTDFIAERPPRFINSDRVYTDRDAFLRKIAHLCTFISANVINKSIVRHVNTDDYLWCKLVQTYLILEALIASKKNLYIREYMVACKRNNSGGFNFLEVFAGQLNKIFDSFVARGFNRSTIRAVNNRMLMEYYPFHLMKLRSAGIGSLQLCTEMQGYFASYPRFWLFIYPMLWLPRAMASVWASALIVVSRMVHGETLRVLSFAWNLRRRGA
jgi:abequosyltransferase